MKKLTYPIICIIAMIAVACHDTKKNDSQENVPTEFEEILTQQDSDAVAKLIDDYFNFAIEGKYYEAAAMLYHTDDDRPNLEPIPFETEDIEDAVKMLQTMPPKSYKIQYMKFSEAAQNEVMCDVVIMEPSGNFPGMSTKMAFKPVNYLGYWVLTVPNFNTGEHTIVKGYQRDSIREAYENLENEKSKTKNVAE